MSHVERFLEHVQSPVDEADLIFAMLPFDKTVSYVPGTQFGPQAILDASPQLEEFDEEYFWEPTNELKIHTLPPFVCGEQESTTQYIDRVTAELAAIPNNKFVFGLGGEHSVTVPLARRCMQPGDTVISIDAHCDLRDSYLGEHYSHASVMKRLFDDGMNLVEIGLRCISREELQLVEKTPRITQYFMHEMAGATGFHKMLHSLEQLRGNVYLSIDADGLCTGIMPGVGTPVPGGFSWIQIVRLLTTLFGNPNISVRSCDLVEVRPLEGNPLSEFTAAKLVQKIMSYQWKLRDAS